MTANSDRPSRPRIRDHEPAAGYGRPPRHHQFQPGRSGNPRGRPKGAKNESTILREILGRKIKNRSGDRVRTISVLEGILLRIADDSLKGDIKSAAFLLNRYGAMVSGELQRIDISEDDRAILEEYAARIHAQRSNNSDQ
jgi:hypothetical protein